MDKFNGIISIRTGQELKSSVEELLQGVKGKRDVYDFIYGEVIGKGDTPSHVVLLQGLRRTGKTIIMNQVIQDLTNKDGIDYNEICMITIEGTGIDATGLKEIITDEVSRGRIKFLFVDEVTLVDGVVNLSRYIYDDFSHKGVKIVMTGTNSYAIILMSYYGLSTRSKLINIPSVSFKEYYMLKEVITSMEYLKTGGIFTKELSGGLDFKKYTFSAITDNIAKSFIANNIDTVIGTSITSIISVVNRVLYNSMFDLYIETFNKTMNLNYASGSRAPRDLLESLRSNLSEVLETRIDAPINKLEVEAVLQVLIEMGVVKTIRNYMTGKTAYTLNRFPGIVYLFCDIIGDYREVIRVLNIPEDEAFEMVNSYRRVTEGRILEGMIVSDIIGDGRSGGITSTLNIDKTVEVDIVHVTKNNVVSLIEVKRSNKSNNKQVRWLVGTVVNSQFRHYKVVNRIVVYNGVTKVLKVNSNLVKMKLKDKSIEYNGITEELDPSVDYVYYINVDEFLLDLDNFLSGNKINQMREEYENPVHNEFINIDTKGIGDGDEYSQHEDTSLLF